MSCKDEKTVNKTTICGSTGYPVPTTSLEPQPQWTGEMASADSAWGKGFLMNLRDGKFSEPARLPNGDWRVNLDSDCGPAFVIIHHDNTFHRHLAVLFDEKGRRVARITSDGNTHTEALESLRQIAAYEDSAIFNMHIEQARHEKLLVLTEFVV